MTDSKMSSSSSESSSFGVWDDQPPHDIRPPPAAQAVPVQDIQPSSQLVAERWDDFPQADRPISQDWDNYEESQKHRGAYSYSTGQLDRSTDSAKKKSNTELAGPQTRDDAATAYSSNTLIEGDTLVITSKDPTAEVYDAWGFALNKEHRVHSEKLLATKSPVFEKMLSPLGQARLLESMPELRVRVKDPIKFVLDLSPKVMDGEVFLYYLSCPEGIRCWYGAQKRNDIPSYVVGGKEETSKAPAPAPGKGKTETNTPAATSTASTIPTGTTPFASLPILGQESRQSTLTPNLSQSTNGASLRTIIPDVVKEEIPEDYTPVRYRACVERLLQLIEGKHARLDSATKVWTVAMLAGYYQCTTESIVDEILTWVYTSDNSAIIEILPEAMYKLGEVLKSVKLTREAFSVLVAEEAFCIRPDTAPSQRPGITPLGRYRDDFSLGEAGLDRVQKAALSFNEQIMATVDEVFDPKLEWLGRCPQFQKLANLADTVKSTTGYGNNQDLRSLTTNIRGLQSSLRKKLYGKLLSLQERSLPISDVEAADRRRKLEHWHSVPREPFDEYYDGLALRQRTCTRPFWYLLDRENPGKLEERLFWHDPNFGEQHATKTLVTSINALAFDFLTRDYEIDNPYMAGDGESFPPDVSKEAYLADQYRAKSSKGVTPTKEELLAHEYINLKKFQETPSSSPFFDLRRFYNEVSKYLASTVTTMLHRKIPECEGFSISDGLFGMGAEQYKFLEMWAGGTDDGSGGVGSDIPPPSSVDWASVEADTFHYVGTNTATAGASTARGFDAASSIGFGSHKFVDLGLSSPKAKGKERVAYAESEAFSDIGYDAAPSEISFASTLDGVEISTIDRNVDALPIAPVRNKVLDDNCSHEFMMEDGEELEPYEEDDDNDDEEFVMAEDSDSEDTETEN